MFLPNKPLLGVQTPLTAAETLWPVNSLSTSHRWSLLRALVPNGLIWVCLFSVQKPAKMFLLQLDGSVLLQKPRSALPNRFLLLLFWENMA